MADNVELDAGSGGAKIATDDDGVAQHQYVKVEFGADNTQTKVTSSAGLPVKVIEGVTPGVGATDLGKAVDTAVGATDTGVAILAKHAAATARLVTDEGDFDVPRLSEFGALLTEPEQHLVIDDMNNLAGFGGTWAAIDTDTTGVASSNKHVLGTASVEFDKVNGAANSGIGGVTKTLTSINLDGASPHDLLQMIVYVGATSELDGGSSYIFLRLGTNSTDYNEWRIDSVNLTAGVWEVVAFEIGDASFAGQGGVGIDWSAITYVAAGFKFDAIDDALANSYIDEISFHTNQHVNASLNAEITSDISSANVNINKVGNKVVNTQAGNISTGTQRVTIATDDVNLAAVKTAVEGAQPVGANLIGDVGISGARTSGGTTIFRSIDLDEGTLEVVKGSAGQIYWMHVMNLSAALIFVKIYNATSGTYGTGTPVLTFPVATQGDTNGAGFMLSVPNGIAFGTGISIGAGTGVADNDTGAPGANEVVVNIGFA